MIDAVLRILALIRKELLSALKDRRGRITLILLPVVQCLIYGYAASYDLVYVPYAVLDRDRTDASRELLSRLDGSSLFRRVAELDTAADLASWIDDGRALVAVQIDRDFERHLLSGEGGSVQAIADGRNSNTAGTVTAYLETIVARFDSDWRTRHGRAGVAIHVRTRAWFNPNLESRWNMIPGLIGTLTMLQTLLFAALSIAWEREQGTFDQLLVTPFRPAEILAGKALASLAIGMLQAGGIVLVAQLWFRIPFAGSFLALAAGLAVFLLAATGIGLAVSSISTTTQQAFLLSFVIVMPFALLSGLTTPIIAMPKAFQYLTLIDPLRYGVELGQRAYLEGVGLDLLWPDIWPMALIAAVTLPLAAFMFRRIS
jgi:ABC-2 type transport system permease protein